MLDQIVKLSKASNGDLTYEQVADFLDVLSKVHTVGDTGTQLQDIAAKGRVQ